MMTRLTRPQLKALAALATLKDGEFMTRYDIGRMANGRAQGYQLKTMLILASLGLVQYESADAVRLVQEEVCRCGCDRWRLTDAGRERAATIKVVDVQPGNDERWF